jgi:preprotein translocase subunit YajC
MSSEGSRSPKPAPQPLAPGDTVVTPSGQLAQVLEVFAEDGEATIEWLRGGERARFRMTLLRRVPIGYT